MRRSFLVAIAWAVAGAPALGLADEKPVDLLGEGDPSIGADGTVTVGDPCEALTLHEPAPDVAYQPGLDAEGNPVAPADLEGGGGSIVGPDHAYDINLTTPLSEVTDTSPGTGAERVKDSELYIGKVTVRGGKVYFNGQLIGDEGAHALAEACARRQAKPAE